MKLLVVIPAFNEEGRVGNVVRDVRAQLPTADVVVVDDASSDSTAAEAREAGAAVLPHILNVGYGAALETGYAHARARGYDAVVQLDADGQHVATDLSVVLAPVLAGRADLVIGSRYLESGTEAASSPLRRFAQRILSAVLLLLTGRRFTDPTSGLQALGRRAIRLFASGVFPCDYPDADVLLMAHLAGLRIEEAPMHVRAREGGTSMHAGWKPIYYGMKMGLAILIVLLEINQWRKWRTLLAATEQPGGA